MMQLPNAIPSQNHVEFSESSWFPGKHGSEQCAHSNEDVGLSSNENRNVSLMDKVPRNYGLENYNVQEQPMCVQYGPPIARIESGPTNCLSRDSLSPSGSHDSGVSGNSDSEGSFRNHLVQSRKREDTRNVAGYKPYMSPSAGAGWNNDGERVTSMREKVERHRQAVDKEYRDMDDKLLFLKAQAKFIKDHPAKKRTLGGATAKKHDPFGFLESAELDDMYLQSQFKLSAYEDEVEMEKINSLLTSAEQERLRNWCEVYSAYEHSWLPKMQFTLSKCDVSMVNRITVTFISQYLSNVHMRNNISFKPIMQQGPIDQEVMKSVYMGACYPFTLPAYEKIASRHIPWAKDMVEFQKLMATVLKNLKKMNLSYLELVVLTNFLTLKVFRKMMPFYCAEEMSREEAFADNMLLTIFRHSRVNSYRELQKIHMISNFIVSKANTFFNFMDLDSDQTV